MQFLTLVTLTFDLDLQTHLSEGPNTSEVGTNLFGGSQDISYTNRIKQTQSEYKHVLANILCSLFVARTPPVEARSPDCRSNVENARVGGGPAAPASRMRRAVLGAPPVARRRRAQTPPSRPFALCRHIAGWTQACN